MLNTNDEAGPTGLETGTKIAAIISALLLAVAVYFFVSPTNFRGKDGSLFGCGSPMSPNTSGLAKGQCNIIEGQSLHRALLFLALALTTAALGYLLFGTHGSGRAARGRERYDRYDEHDDDDDERPVRPARRERRDAEERPARRARLGDEDRDAERHERGVRIEKVERAAGDDGEDDDVHERRTARGRKRLSDQERD